MLLVVASAGPRWGYDPEPETAAGRDIVVLLDVSRSMNAEDVLPSRLDRAKQALGALADAVQKRGGHRLALVAFAGQARVICPLTPDYDHFRADLADLEPGDPLLAPRPAGGGYSSGTRMGLGLHKALELHDPRLRNDQAILMISDGDDPLHDDEWRAGAAQARTLGVAVVTVGIGVPDKESPIYDPAGRPLLHNGKEIRTRLKEKPLEEIARITGGLYLPARTDPPPLEEWFRRYIQSGADRSAGKDVLPALRQRYPWFCAVALVLLTLALVVGDRGAGGRSREASGERKRPEESSQVRSQESVHTGSHS